MANTVINNHKAVLPKVWFCTKLLCMKMCVCEKWVDTLIAVWTSRVVENQQTFEQMLKYVAQSLSTSMTCFWRNNNTSEHNSASGIQTKIKRFCIPYPMKLTFAWRSSLEFNLQKGHGHFHFCKRQFRWKILKSKVTKAKTRGNGGRCLHAILGLENKNKGSTMYLGDSKWFSGNTFSFWYDWCHTYICRRAAKQFYILEPWVDNPNFIGGKSERKQDPQNRSDCRFFCIYEHNTSTVSKHE